MKNTRKADPRIQEMRTPQWLFDRLNKEFGPFKLDAAASRENALCKNYYTAAVDNHGLTCTWRDVTFCNPPYKNVAAWVEKAYREFINEGHRSVNIWPCGGNQKWFHRYVLGKAMILLPNGRINFDMPDGTPTKSARGDTMIVVYGGRPSIHTFNWKEG